MYFIAKANLGFDNWIDTIYFNPSNRALYRRQNLGITYGAIIENVTGGPSSDTVYDNKVNNGPSKQGRMIQFHLGAGGMISLSQARVAIPYFYPLPFASFFSNTIQWQFV